MNLSRTLLFGGLLELARVALLHLLDGLLLILIHFILQINQRLNQNLFVVFRLNFALQTLNNNGSELFKVLKLQGLVEVFVYLRLVHEVFKLIGNKINDIAHDKSLATWFMCRLTDVGVEFGHAIFQSVEEVH